ncbi:HYR domain-containing protein, partial [Algoriphagus sp. SE2]|uniref:HYR-like domain-containing protein n=1 Tax=Algoriphagus sp. SE2 TaxID=3141536 RepID=UPI0031CCF850
LLPVISGCPTDIIVSNDLGNCSAVVTWTPPTASGAGTVILTSNFEPGAVFSVGTTKVTYTATDGFGNQSSCSFDVTVNDSEAPVPPTPPADITVLSAAQIPTPVDLTAIDNCEGSITVSPTIQIIKDPSACDNNYTEIRTWTFVDAAGNLSFVDQTITVFDNNPPVLISPLPVDLTLSSAADVPPPVDLTFADPEDLGTIDFSPTEQIIPGSCVNEFTLIRTWQAVDECGNMADPIIQTITVLDNEKPVAPAAPADVTVQCAGDVPPRIDLTATDNADGPITVSPTSTITFGANGIDFTEVRTWAFIDGCGNFSSVSQTITVKDTEAPNATSLGEAVDLEIDVNAIPNAS